MKACVDCALGPKPRDYYTVLCKGHDHQVVVDLLLVSSVGFQIQPETQVRFTALGLHSG
jgi:hypothetical protein